MSMKICLETTGACYFEMSIFSGTQLPKKYCITGSAFYDSGNNHFIFKITFCFVYGDDITVKTLLIPIIKCYIY